jgi:hypothetical protein
VDEISISIDINISNLGQTTYAKIEVDTALVRSNSLLILMVALVIDRSSDLSGSILTATVASELELNGISPPPDMVEEEKSNSMYPSS